MRIFVMGQSGSGKSTFAKNLARKFRVPFYELDPIWVSHGAYKHSRKHPSWREAGLAVEKEVQKIVSKPRWVIDGNYSNVRPMIMKRADLIVYLNVPIGRRVLNNLKRHFGPGKNIRHFWRRHLPRIIVRSRKRAKGIVEQTKPYARKLVVLRSHKEATQFLEFIKTNPQLREVHKKFHGK